jgi:hypothetical protein
MNLTDLHLIDLDQTVFRRAAPQLKNFNSNLPVPAEMAPAGRLTRLLLTQLPLTQLAADQKAVT